MAILDSLFVKLGYDYDESKLEQFNEFVEESGRLVKKLSLAAIGLATAFSILFLKVSQNALAQARFGKAMGLSRNTVSAFERASDKLTGNRGTATALLETFNGINNAWKAGVKPSDDYIRGITELGLNFNDFIKLSPDEQLLQVSEAFQKAGKNTKDMATHLLNLNGDARNLVSTLTRKSIADNMPTDADIARAEKFDNLLKDFNNTLRDAALVAGVELFPMLDNVFSSLSDNLPKIIEFTKSMIEGFLTFGEVLGKVFGFFSIEIDKLIQKLEKLLGFEIFSPAQLGKAIGQGVFSLFGDKGSEPAAPNVSNNRGGSTQNNNIEINVTANDTEGAGIAVKNGVEQAIQNAGRNAEGQERI